MTNEPTVQRTKKNQVECTVEFTEAQLAPAEEKALLALGKDVKSPGFRPGKVPVEILKEKIDPGKLFEQTIRNLLPSVLEKLVTENDIKPIVAPKVEAVSQDPVVIKITFIERPEVKLKGIDKIRIEKKELKVDQKDSDRMVEYILKQHEKTEVVEREVKAGDKVTMDFWGEDDSGKEIENTRSKDYQVVVGSKTLIPGFEDELVGLKAGDSKSFGIVFPEKYQAEHLRNQKAVFHVTVSKVEEVTKPELTDEFVKQNLREDSVKAFKDNLEKSMMQQEEEIENRRRENALLDAIRDCVEADFAQELIDDETSQLFEEFAEQLKSQNMGIEEWLQQTKKDPQEFGKELKKKAEDRIKLRYGMQALVEERGEEISDEDMKLIIDEHISPLSDEEKAKAASEFEKGKKAYEQLLWQKKVEKVLADLLKK